MRTPVQIDVSSNKAGQEAIVGRSKPMQDVYKAIGRVSTSDATVLIRGESGTGKELVARAIYQHSLRAQKPFLVINCVAIPENLLESELFGYERGAFTGAAHRRVGKIEQVHGGTVFLDEIGDMPSSIQSKILRLLQEKSIERLGGRGTIPVDVRILAATNRDLETALAQGRFREDLYYRLKVVTIALPPLRQRRDDIPLLTDFFLARYAAELGMDNPGITPDVAATLNSHQWPGNVRELANTMQKALIFSRGAPIRAEDVIQALSAEKIPGEPDSREAEDIIRHWMRGAMTSKAEQDTFEKIMDHLAGILVGEALNLTDGNRSRAAKLLGLSRPTLHSKIEKYGLKLKTSVKEKQQD
jgi:DNA-binding NtrC family response regulator